MNNTVPQKDAVLFVKRLGTFAQSRRLHDLSSVLLDFAKTCGAQQQSATADVDSAAFDSEVKVAIGPALTEDTGSSESDIETSELESQRSQATQSSDVGRAAALVPDTSTSALTSSSGGRATGFPIAPGTSPVSQHAGSLPPNRVRREQQTGGTMDLVIRLNDMTLEFDRMAVRQPRYMFHVEEMKYLHNLRLWKRGEAEYRLPTGAHLRVKLRFSPQSKNQKELSGEALIDRSELNLSTLVHTCLGLNYCFRVGIYELIVHEERQDRQPRELFRCAFSTTAGKWPSPPLSELAMKSSSWSDSSVTAVDSTDELTHNLNLMQLSAVQPPLTSANLPANQQRDSRGSPFESKRP